MALPKAEETTRRHRENKIPSASAASEASGAIQVFGSIFFRIFGEIHGNRRKEHDNVGKTTLMHLLQDFLGDSRKPPKRTRQRRTNKNNYTRFPFPYLDRFMLGGVFEPDALKTLQDCPRRAKTCPRRAKTRPRRAKTPPRRAKTRPRRAQDAPRHAKTRPRRAKTPQDAPKTRLRSIFNDF